MREMYQMENNRNGRKHIHFFKNPNLGFDFEFDIYLPENTRPDANLLLSFYDKIHQERLDGILDAIRAPIMVTNVENAKDEYGNNIDFKQFDRNSLINDDGNIRGYGTLNSSIIEQYKAAIREAYKVLKQMQIIKKEKEKQEKYDTNNIFNNKGNAIYDNKENNQENAIIDISNIKWYKKIWITFKNLLEKSKTLLCEIKK